MFLRFEPSLAAVPRETDRILGAARLGPAAVARPDWPCQQVTAPLLFGHFPASTVQDELTEAWLSAAPTQGGVSDGIVWRRAGELLYGVLELDEADFIDAAAGMAPLQAASAEAYRRIFRLLEAQGLPHLWRIWNYLADINGESDGPGQGLERYRQFNIGRQDAFLEADRAAVGNVPAACAIGLAGGPLSIAFLAGPTPAVPVENPRQLSAYHYPAEYGPRSPTFSRAALVHPPSQEILFVSGTASIVGHRTVHPGDVAGQCREALLNIATVITEANRVARSRPFTAGELDYRVYLRDAADWPAIAEALLAATEGGRVVCVQADICRADLLIEIEAFASHALED